jgi:hypothetical protein
VWCFCFGLCRGWVEGVDDGDDDKRLQPDLPERYSSPDSVWKLW